MQKTTRCVFSLFKASCNSQLCSNGGTCVSMSNGQTIKCACPPGYTGDLCQNLVQSMFNLIKENESIESLITLSSQINVFLNHVLTVALALKAHLHMIVNALLHTEETAVNLLQLFLVRFFSLISKQNQIFDF